MAGATRDKKKLKTPEAHDLWIWDAPNVCDFSVLSANFVS